MSKKKHVIQLHYFMLRDRVTDYKEALHIRKHKYYVKPGPTDLDFESELWVFSRKKTPPSWLPFLQLGFVDLEPMENSHYSAVLFVRTKEARFAIPFGYGHSKVNLESVVRDFGRQVVTNTVKSDGISSMNLRDFNEISISRTEEASRGTRQEVFAVNAEAELLTAIAGIPEDPFIGKRIAGAEGLKLSREMAFEDLGVICLRLRQEYLSDVYKSRGFDWIDNMLIVKDKSRIEELDLSLVEELKTRSEAIQISAPGYFDRESISYFRYSEDSSTRLSRSYLTIQDWYRAHERKLSKVTPEMLRKKWIVEAINATDGFVQRATVMDSFVHDLALGDDRYVLSSGKWYKVQRTFIESLDKSIKEITPTTSTWPLTDKGMEEDDYVNELEKRSDVTVYHLKGKNFPSGRGSVEPCDVYWHDGKFMHIKRWSSSASFSHCLSQGGVSAMTCNTSPDFRKHMVATLGTCPALTKRPFQSPRFTTSNLTVVFALMRNVNLDLPFFSKVNLVNTSRQVQRMGYQVEYWEIKDKP
ncbi:MAG: TIGR04141 family sporadically distributed protein [Flavobacteriales bacterium]